MFIYINLTRIFLLRKGRKLIVLRGRIINFSSSPFSLAQHSSPSPLVFSLSLFPPQHPRTILIMKTFLVLYKVSDIGSDKFSLFLLSFPKVEFPFKPISFYISIIKMKWRDGNLRCAVFNAFSLFPVPPSLDVIVLSRLGKL